MKRTMPVVLISLIVLGASCNLFPPPSESNGGLSDIDPCVWDKEISEDTAVHIFDNWVNKWDTNQPVPPNMFFINRDSLESLVNFEYQNPDKSFCGFRAYYGLTKSGDMTTMGLILVAINDCLTDQLNDWNKIFFTNLTSPDDGPNFEPQRITKKVAQDYTRNWREYNSVCLESDVLGNKICPVASIQRIPKKPQGNLPNSVVQVVPLGLNFTGIELFDLLYEENSKATAYIFYNSMFSIFRKEGLPPYKRTGFRYDLFMKGYGPDSNGKMGPIDLLDDPSGYAVDISGGCPFMCDDQDDLQAN